MIKMILDTIRFTRAVAMRALKPKMDYFLATRSIRPLSSKFGFDRGTPIDRYYIEQFLEENKKNIKGVCLEIGDDRYTKQFGRNHIKKSDVLDIDKKNKKANIYGDLRSIKKIKDNTYDCLIITHVIGMIDNYQSAIGEMKRILKKGGTLLATVSAFSPTYDVNSNFWRFTVAGANYAFAKHFGQDKVKVKSFGNVLSGQCFWVGMAQEELTKQELDFNDPHFPCVVAIKANK